MNHLRRYIVAGIAVTLISILLTLGNADQVFGQAHALLVQVVNTPAAPVLTRDVDRPSSQPFQVVLTGFSIPDGFRGDSVCITVPSGKRLTLEFASAVVNLPSGQNSAVSLFVAPPDDCDDDDAVMRHDLITVLEEPEVQTGRDLHKAAQSLRMYADAGQLVVGRLGRAEFTGTLTGTISLTGYLTDLP